MSKMMARNKTGIPVDFIATGSEAGQRPAWTAGGELVAD